VRWELKGDRIVASHKVVSRDGWIEARKRFLVKEKEFTRLRDQLSLQRRDLPWEAVDRAYVFGGPDGKQTLPDLFDGVTVGEAPASPLRQA
jgi:predicted dithiol-disulfide oxidoreductase (DUF899 family)